MPSVKKIIRVRVSWLIDFSFPNSKILWEKRLLFPLFPYFNCMLPLTLAWRNPPFSCVDTWFFHFSCMGSTFSCMPSTWPLLYAWPSLLVAYIHMTFTLLWPHDPIICKVWPMLWSTNSTIAHLIRPVCVQPHSSNLVVVLLPVSSLIPSSSGSDLITSFIWLPVPSGIGCQLHPISGCRLCRFPIAGSLATFVHVDKLVKSNRSFCALNT